MPHSASRPRKSRALGLCGLIAAALTVGAFVTGCSTDVAQPPVATAVPTVTVPTGTVGAAYLDEGFVQIGSGSKVVDLYIDPLCPYCKLFEQSSGPMLFSEAANGTATVRVHPLATLNRLSQGSMYSTRAAAMLTAVAAEQPEKTQPFLEALFERQPAEGSTGLDDGQLEQLAGSVGVTLVLTGEQLAPYRAWVDQHTTQAVTGPLATTDEIASVQHVPTVIVNGAVFQGDSHETDAFALFYASR